MRSYVLTPLMVMLIRGYIATWVAITQFIVCAHAHAWFHLGVKYT